MLQKYKLLLTVSLLVVLAIFAWFTLQKDSSKAGIDIDANAYAFTDTNYISRVTVVQKSAIIAIIHKKGKENWLLNNKYKIDYPRIKLLFSMLSTIKIKRPVSAKKIDEQMNLLKNEGLHINLISGNGTLIRAYKLYEDKNNGSLTMLINDQKKPYVIEIPGYAGIISDFFSIKEENWRSRQLFNSSIRTLNSVMIKSDNNSFTLNYKNGFFEMDDKSTLDSNKLGIYLIRFKDIKHSGFLSDTSTLVHQFVTKSSPMAEVSLTDIDSTKNNHLLLYKANKTDDFVIGYSIKSKEYFKMGRYSVRNIFVGKKELLKAN